MTRAPRLLLCGTLLLAFAVPSFAQNAERIREIRVHGNHTTPDADILGLSGLSVGDDADPARLMKAEHALDASQRFDRVDVRRRYRSLADPTDILVVILVDERVGVSDTDTTPGPLGRLRAGSLWFPILRYEEGYGSTYGVRVTNLDMLGRHTRLSMPLTWGGERRVGVEIERPFRHETPLASSATTGQPLLTLRGGLALAQTDNPHYRLVDRRFETRGSIERTVIPALRVGVHAAAERVTFGLTTDWHPRLGANVTIDTRLDPSFPRNALYAKIGWDRIGYRAVAVPVPATATGRTSAARWTSDVRGYAGVLGSTVLVLRGRTSVSSAPLPLSEQPLLGGETLRGYGAGYRVGDNLATLSLEVRQPLTSPLAVKRIGLLAFVDHGTTWGHGQRLHDQHVNRGIGGGVYVGMASFRGDLTVAWPEHGSPRVQMKLGMTF